MEDNFILEMDLISRHGVTIDLVREVLRLGNQKFKLNQRCIEAKPARLIAYQNCKHCDDVEYPKARFIRRRWSRTARLVGNIKRITFFQGIMGSIGLLACRERIA